MSTGYGADLWCYDQLCNAIADAVVTHITAAAVVTIPPGVPVATTGTAAAQAGALTALCNAIADAVVTHITAAAVVTIPPGVPVATTGTAVAQAGATTAPAVGAIT